MASDNQQQNAGTKMLGGCLVVLILFVGVCGGCCWWIWPWWRGDRSENELPPPGPLVGKQDGKFAGLKKQFPGK